MTRVNCSVDNCYYNKDGKICDADAIKVRQSIEGRGTDMEAGSMESGTSEGTACETFRPRGSGDNDKDFSLF
ncbi:MAG: DUF1540 domain-containing protein [Bacillota bacterium]